MINKPIFRRDFLTTSAGCLAFLPGMRGLPWSLSNDGKDGTTATIKRLVIMFTPNGMVKEGFWPTTEGADFEITPVLKPLEPFREQMLIVKGICNQVRGDGDNHMRGMSCLLTGNELLPGNIQGGSHTPAGWAKGISIDQEIKNFLQSQSTTQTRFGSLEFGVQVPDVADPWTRMVYAGPNQPVAPISDPYQMFKKMFGTVKDREALRHVLDLVRQDFERVGGKVDPRDRAILESNQKFVANARAGLDGGDSADVKIVSIELPENVANSNDQIPQLSKMQMDLMVSSFENDFNRIASLQFTKSVGGARMKWLDIDEGHHGLSHEPDKNVDAQDKLKRINHWYAEQLAYLVRRLKETKEPGTNESMLDNTLIVWTNELGHGNSHTLSNLPVVMIGGGFGFEMGRYTEVDNVSTTRLWLAIAHAMGHQIDAFGLPRLCKDGPVVL